MRPCNEIIMETFVVINKMLDLSDKGDAVREDERCGILYSVVRDSAYKIKKLAEAEKEAHIKRGHWE